MQELLSTVQEPRDLKLQLQTPQEDEPSVKKPRTRGVPRKACGSLNWGQAGCGAQVHDGQVFEIANPVKDAEPKTRIV